MYLVLILENPDQAVAWENPGQEVAWENPGQVVSWENPGQVVAWENPDQYFQYPVGSVLSLHYLLGAHSANI